MPGRRGVQPMPKTFEAMNDLDREKSKQCAEKPQSSENAKHRGTGNDVGSAKSHAFGDGNNSQEEKDDVDHPGPNAERHPAPVRGNTPNGAIPKTLGEKKERKNAQTDGDAQQQKAPIHSDCAPQA